MNNLCWMDLIFTFQWPLYYLVFKKEGICVLYNYIQYIFNFNFSNYNKTTINRFCQEQREIITKERPGITHQELTKLIGTMWNALQEQSKEVRTSPFVVLANVYDIYDDKVQLFFNPCSDLSRSLFFSFILNRMVG